MRNLEVTLSSGTETPDDIGVKTATIQANPTCVASTPDIYHFLPANFAFPSTYYPGQKYPKGIWFEVQPTSETTFIKWGLIVDDSLHIPYHRVGDDSSAQR